MMKLAILGARGGWHESRLVQALAERGQAPLVLPITALSGRVGGNPVLAAAGEPLEDCRAVLVRAIPGGSLEQVIFRVDALHRLARLGVRVVNPPRAIELTVDKYYTSTLLAEAGLPTPRTSVAERFDEALALFDELGGDVIVKPLFGSEGKGMMRVSDPDLAYRTFRALELTNSIFYLQEFIPHGDWDMRVFVVGGQVVAGMVRRGDSWKTNVARGAQAEPLEVGPELAWMSVRAAALVGAEYAGVDLLQAEDGRVLVIEVNGIPGWKGLQRTTSVDIAGVIAGHILSIAGPEPGASGE